MRVNHKFYIIGLIVVAAITTTVNYYKTPRRIGVSEEFAKNRMDEVLSDTTSWRWNRGDQQIFLIKTKEDAISIAEPILFGIYGKEKILSERPYGVFKFDHYWYLSGSLPRLYTAGGGFEIILDSRDARVLHITHYK